MGRHGQRPSAASFRRRSPPASRGGRARAGRQCDHHAAAPARRFALVRHARCRSVSTHCRRAVAALPAGSGRGRIAVSPRACPCARCGWHRVDRHCRGPGTLARGGLSAHPRSGPGSPCVGPGGCAHVGRRRRRCAATHRDGGSRVCVRAGPAPARCHARWRALACAGPARVARRPADRRAARGGADGVGRTDTPPYRGHARGSRWRRVAACRPVGGLAAAAGLACVPHHRGCAGPGRGTAGGMDQWTGRRRMVGRHRRWAALDRRDGRAALPPGGA